MDNIQIIEKEIFENPTYRFHVRELARKTGLNPNTITKLSRKLIREGIISRKKTKNLAEIYADVDNKNFLRRKRLFNIWQLYNCGLVDFLVSYYDNPEAVVVFGSYSRGEDIEGSDIDIAVVTSQKKMPSLSKYEGALKRSIHLLAMEYKKISEEFYKNMVNGAILHGFLSLK